MALALAIAMTAGAHASSEPAVPPGLDPGGVAIALLGSGVDYTNPKVARALARDGEGDPIAWDFTDNDVKPFAAASTNTEDAVYLAAKGAAIRLVVVKEPIANPAAVGHMAAFTTRTPARILVWPAGTPDRPDWPVLLQAAQRFTDRLFIVPAPGAASPVPPKPIANILLADGSDDTARRRQALDLALRAAAMLATKPALAPQDITTELGKQP